MKINIFKFFLNPKNKLYKNFTIIIILFLLAIISEKKCLILEGNNDLDFNLNFNKINIISNLQTDNTHFPLIFNFPNPFTATTYIYIRLPQKDNCEIKIFDLFGNIVKIYFLEGKQEYLVIWDGKNELSQQVSAGGYICVLNYHNFKVVRKIGYIR